MVIAAITSCTNTSNPEVMVAAGLIARRAAELGLAPKPWVKTSLAPGSRVVMDYLDRAGLTESLNAIGFDLVGFGCTTCIGNSGPLLPGVSEAVRNGDLAVASVLSGNRNFEGRIHPEVRMNYLASPPLVVAYALAGTVDVDLTRTPLGTGSDGRPVSLRDLWPDAAEVARTIESSLGSDMFRRRYSAVFDGDERWRAITAASGDTFAWDESSTYVLRCPFLDGVTGSPGPVDDVVGARVLAMLGDSVTTDHISPAGSIGPDTPAGRYLTEHGVEPKDFNSYGARRGNHEVMMRGTFANVRLRNQLAPGTEGGFTVHQPSGEQMTIYEASVRYAGEGVPLVVLAGKEYGSGSSRDWAAKGTVLLGVRAVLAESYERIHRSNLVGMGVLPLQYAEGQNAASLGLTGREVFEIDGLGGLDGGERPKTLSVRASEGDRVVEFEVRLRIDTPMEAQYYRNGRDPPLHAPPDGGLRRGPASRPARQGQISARQGQDEEGDHHVVEHRPEDRADVEHLVVPEHSRHRVGAFRGIDDGPCRVGKAAGEQKGEPRGAERGGELREHHQRSPAHRHVGHGDHPLGGVEPELAEGDPDERPRPDDAEHRGPSPAVERDPRNRGVRAGDREEDRRVIRPPHPSPARRTPGVPVEQCARPEQGGDGHGIDDHDRGRTRGGCHDDEGEPAGERDEEGDLVDDAAQRRLDGRGIGFEQTGRAGRTDLGPFRRGIGLARHRPVPLTARAPANVAKRPSTRRPTASTCERNRSSSRGVPAGMSGCQSSASARSTSTWNWRP